MTVEAIHLEVPFFGNVETAVNPEGIHCLEMSLRMILGYFEPDHEYSLPELEKISGKQPDKATWQMAFLTWLSRRGYAVKHFATFDFAKFRDEGTGYIRREYGDEVADWQIKNSDNELARSEVDDFLGSVMVIDRKPMVADIATAMRAGAIVQASVDMGVLNDLGRYVGHSVVVVGVDSQHVWVHDPGLPAVPNRKLSHTLMQQAMDSFGSEMSVISRSAELASTV